MLQDGVARRRAKRPYGSPAIAVCCNCLAVSPPLSHTNHEPFTGIVKVAATTKLLFKRELKSSRADPKRSIFFVSCFLPPLEVYITCILNFSQDTRLLHQCMHVVKHTFVRLLLVVRRFNLTLVAKLCEVLK